MTERSEHGRPAIGFRDIGQEYSSSSLFARLWIYHTRATRRQAVRIAHPSQRTCERHGA
jgi:hypothetical protein